MQRFIIKVSHECSPGGATKFYSHDCGCANQQFTDLELLSITRVRDG